MTQHDQRAGERGLLWVGFDVVAYAVRKTGISGAAARRMIGAEEPNMRIEEFSFGRIQIDGVTYEHDVVIDHGNVRRRKKKPSKKYRGASGHTPLSAEEEIPWKCRRLIIGTGAHGALPVMDDVKREAARREIELLILPTAEAINALRKPSDDTNAILHVTC